MFYLLAIFAIIVFFGVLLFTGFLYNILRITIIGILNRSGCSQLFNHVFSICANEPERKSSSQSNVYSEGRLFSIFGDG